MPIDPDDLPLKKKHTEIVLGQDISAMSAYELGARIADVEAEIARCREAIGARRATKDPRPTHSSKADRSSRNALPHA